MKGLLRIGDLARLGGVSIKALRFYDEQGLLTPDHVDPQTGYRYYSADQAKDLAEITNLRAVDFSIQEIAALLSGDGANIADALAEKKQELRRAKQALDDKIRLADALVAISDEGGDGALTLRLREVENRTVYALKKNVPSLGRPITHMFETAEAMVAQDDARAPAAPFLIFHDPPTRDADLTVEVCIPITTEPDSFSNAKVVKGGYGVSSVYQGGYARTAPLYENMTAQIARAGLRASGPSQEIYHRFGADQEEFTLPAKMLARRPAEYLTELLIPIDLPETPKEA